MYQYITDVKRCIESKAVFLDKDLAIEYLGNSEEVYNILIKTYLSEYKGYDKLLLSYLESKDYNSLAMNIHKLKGICLYLGSKMMHEYSGYIVDKLREVKTKKSKYSMNEQLELEGEVEIFVDFAKLIYDQYDSTFI